MRFLTPRARVASAEPDRSRDPLHLVHLRNGLLVWACHSRDPGRRPWAAFWSSRAERPRSVAVLALPRWRCVSGAALHESRRTLSGADGHVARLSAVGQGLQRPLHPPGYHGVSGLVALGISDLRGSRRWIATALLAGLFLWSDAQWFFASRYWKEDSRSAVAWLQSRLPPGARVAVAPGYQAEVLTYYARRGRANLVFAGLPDTLPPSPPRLRMLC